MSLKHKLAENPSYDEYFLFIRILNKVYYVYLLNKVFSFECINIILKNKIRLIFL